MTEKYIIQTPIGKIITDNYSQFLKKCSEVEHDWEGKINFKHRCESSDGTTVLFYSAVKTNPAQRCVSMKEFAQRVRKSCTEEAR